MRFDLEPIASAPIEILIHLVAAIVSTIVATVILLNRKGTRFHKTLGWTFVIGMTVTAVSAMFIHSVPGLPTLAGFSPIHLFVVLTAVSLPRAILNIRKGKVKAHAVGMVSLFAGAIVLAGAFAFLPGRLLHRVFFG